MGPSNSVSNGSSPDRSQSRLLRNLPRQVSLCFFALAVGALVIGGGFAEISTNGSPTSLETAIVRFVIVGSLVLGTVAYVIGGRRRTTGQR